VFCGRDGNEYFKVVQNMVRKSLGASGMEIKIEYLTKRQRQMMQFIWTCKDMKDFTLWLDSLSWNEKLIAESLLQVLQYEILDFEVGDNVDDAKAVLDRVAKKQQ
jgi:hypothetical protein